eukprot:jgi/Tetstr1/428964/TSEL_018939.t1
MPTPQSRSATRTPPAQHASAPVAVVERATWEAQFQLAAWNELGRDWRLSNAAKSFKLCGFPSALFASWVNDIVKKCREASLEAWDREYSSVKYCERGDRSMASAASGYSCDCDAHASDRKEVDKRKYTWGKGSQEVADSDTDKGSSLISKHTSRDNIRLMLAKEASEQSPCCSRKCVHTLYTQYREALVNAVLERALTVYSGNQSRSFDRLAQVLRGGYESASDKFDYMFDHGGYSRSFDHRGPFYTCGRAWDALHHVSRRRRLVIQRSVVDNEPTYIRQRKQYGSRQTGPREHVRMFLDHFFSDDLGHVEIMPFHDGNSETFKKHQPPGMTKICVYYN